MFIKDLAKNINGGLQTADDTDYINFTAEESKDYSILCLSNMGVTATLCDRSKTKMSEGESLTSTLTAGQTYY